MSVSRRQLFLALAVFPAAPSAFGQNSAREARKASERARKEAEKRAKRAQKEVRRREQEILKQLKERDSERARQTKRLLKERQRQQKEIASSEASAASPYEAGGAEEKSDKPKIRSKQRGVELPAANAPEPQP